MTLKSSNFVAAMIKKAAFSFNLQEPSLHFFWITVLSIKKIKKFSLFLLLFLLEA